MRLFRFITTVTHSVSSGRTPSHFSDWYEGATFDEANSVYLEDLHRYGLASENYQTRVVEYRWLRVGVFKPIMAKAGSNGLNPSLSPKTTHTI